MPDMSEKSTCSHIIQWMHFATSVAPGPLWRFVHRTRWGNLHHCFTCYRVLLLKMYCHLATGSCMGCLRSCLRRATAGCEEHLASGQFWWSPHSTSLFGWMQMGIDFLAVIVRNIYISAKIEAGWKPEATCLFYTKFVPQQELVLTA